jgi:hypothetical protein
VIGSGCSTTRDCWCCGGYQAEEGGGGGLEGLQVVLGC